MDEDAFHAQKRSLEAQLFEQAGKCPCAGSVNADEESRMLAAWQECLRVLPLKGRIQGILHTKNDSVADVVKNEGTDILYGQDFFYEELLGLKFKISPFFLLPDEFARRGSALFNSQGIYSRRQSGSARG